MAEEHTGYNPLVSVIIPCYNGEKYLGEALDSVYAQSYTNWECIVADDGSTDNSGNIALSYMQKDSRFKYVRQHNCGPSAARNLGIKVSKGEFFQFLDSDDMIEKEKLKRQVEIFREFPDCDLVYSNMKYFSRSEGGEIEINKKDDKHWIQGTASGKGDEIISILLKGNIMVVDSPLIKKTVFGKIGLWDEQIWFNEDWDVWTRCALGGLSFRYDDTKDTNSLVRFHTESRSRDLFQMYLNGLKVCLKINRVIKLRKYKKIVKPKIYHHYRVLEKYALEKYYPDKVLARSMTSTLYRETGLVHYRIFTWLVDKMPYILCLMYSKLIYLFNRVKCKVIYES